MPDVSIIILSYNGRVDVERCLTSLRDAPPVRPHEIIVVDNASTDGTAEVVRRFANVQLIVADANRGFAAGNNLGIRASRGAAVLLLNNDTIVPAGAIDTLLAALDAHPDVAVVGPRIVDGEGRAELSFGPMTSPLGHVRQKLALRQVETLTRREQYPDWVTGACLLVRRADADAVGLLDEGYFIYMEDVDFCAAIRARGRRVLFTPAAQITHFRGRSFSSKARNSLAHSRSLLIFYRKYHPFWYPLVRLYLLLFHADK
jgi:N-acetylglucosaminyl-diphospho-decaprenol L-rhamnosyltransferase